MATADASSARSAPDPAPPAPLLERYYLARLVVVGSFLTLFLLVGTLIALSQSNSTAGETAKNAFTAILPVLAGWVGTVLAFYFSAASQERTSASLDKVLGRSGAGVPSPNRPVSEKMVSFGSIAELQKLEEKDAKTLKVSDLQASFKKALPNGAAVTRLLFVEKGVFKYVLHISTLNAFILNKQKDGKSVDEIGKLPFAEMLADEETLRQISKLVVFVSATATLADAKAALDKVTGAQDIIVTGSGNSTDPMLGWLSNVDLIKELQAT